MRPKSGRISTLGAGDLLPQVSLDCICTYSVIRWDFGCRCPLVPLREFYIQIYPAVLFSVSKKQSRAIMCPNLGRITDCFAYITNEP